MAFAAYDAQALGHFCVIAMRRPQAAYKSNLADPAHSITCVQLAGSLATLGGSRRGRVGSAMN